MDRQTDRQTDRQLDGQCHNIIFPILRWAYNNRFHMTEIVWISKMTTENSNPLRCSSINFTQARAGHFVYWSTGLFQCSWKSMKHKVQCTKCRVLEDADGGRWREVVQGTGVLAVDSVPFSCLVWLTPPPLFTLLVFRSYGSMCFTCCALSPLLAHPKSFNKISRVQLNPFRFVSIT